MVKISVEKWCVELRGYGKSVGLTYYVVTLGVLVFDPACMKWQNVSEERPSF